MVEDEYVELPFPKTTKELPVQKIKPPSMLPCHTCEKLTRSHKYPDGVYLCHGCYDKMPEEERNEFARKHTKEWYTLGNSRKPEANSDNPGKAQEQKMQG